MGGLRRFQCADRFRARGSRAVRRRAGQRAALPGGSSVSFGDFRCRTDATTLVCVNYARKTGVRYSDDGIDTYGCARQSPTPPGIGEQYAC